jgi:hypothetical protein
MLVRRDAAGVRLFTCNGHDWTGRFPLIAPPLTPVNCERGRRRYDLHKSGANSENGRNVLPPLIRAAAESMKPYMHPRASDTIPKHKRHKERLVVFQKNEKRCSKNASTTGSVITLACVRSKNWISPIFVRTARQRTQQ